MRKLLRAALAIAWTISLALPVRHHGKWRPRTVVAGLCSADQSSPLGAMVAQFAWFDQSPLLVPALHFPIEHPPVAQHRASRC